MFKKLFKYLFLIVIFLLLAKPASAKEVTLHLFWAIGCPHCEKERVFLDTLKEKYPELSIKEYEITSRSQNLELLKKAGEKLKVSISGVPFTVIGGDYFAGYLSDETTGKEIEEEVKCSIANGCEDLISGLTSGEQTVEKETEEIPKSLNTPILGELQMKNLSLPLLTLVIGLLDGFNPCAMWILLFLISFLLGMKNRKRMWVLGVAFIVASAAVYFLFLAAWLNFFLFLGFVIWVRIAIGLVALTIGGYYLRDYLFNKPEVCVVEGNKKRQRVFEKIRDIAQKPSFLLAIFGIVLLAFAVNLVELICSAGFPAIYTKILSLSNLPPFQYYLYLLLYIFFFILDDLLVFFIAMITFQVVGLNNKYSRFSHLIGGILMFTIGLLLLFKPQWLMFG